MRYLPFLVISLIIFSAVAYAQTGVGPSQPSGVGGGYSPVTTDKIELPDAGLTPDSSFYFLKTWKESIQTFFTFGAENKAEQFMHLAEVRLAEYQKMIEKGKTEIAEKTLEKYEQQLNRALEKAEEAKEQGKDIEKLVISISETTLKHQGVLNNVLKKVPEEAKRGIENAIEMSKKGLETAIRAVSGERKEELETKVEETKSAVCIQVITPAISPENVCKEFPTPCDIPKDWKKVDACPRPTAAPLPVPVSTPAPTQAPIPIPVPVKTSAPATSVACCNTSGGCKIVDTKETCLGMSFKPMSISSCSPNPCPQPTPVYNGCKQGPMKDYKCPGGTLVRWQCNCTAKADGEEERFCSVKPVSSCPGLASATSLTITEITVRHLLWMTKEWTIVDHIFWTTNILANSYVEYGPTTSYGFTAGHKSSPSTPTIIEYGIPKTEHGTDGLPGQRNTTYHFRIIAEDTKGNKIVSDDYTFTTGL